MITQRKDREIEYLAESIAPLWVQVKLCIFLGDNILSVGMTEELEYLLFCLDTILEKKKIEQKVVRRIIR